VILETRVTVHRAQLTAVRVAVIGTYTAAPVRELVEARVARILHEPTGSRPRQLGRLVGSHRIAIARREERLASVRVELAQRGRVAELVEIRELANVLLEKGICSHFMLLPRRAPRSSSGQQKVIERVVLQGAIHGTLSSSASARGPVASEGGEHYRHYPFYQIG
jgi:hypothetical protein